MGRGAWRRPSTAGSRRQYDLAWPFSAGLRRGAGIASGLRQTKSEELTLLTTERSSAAGWWLVEPRPTHMLSR